MDTIWWWTLALSLWGGLPNRGRLFLWMVSLIDFWMVLQNVSHIIIILFLSYSEDISHLLQIEQQCLAWCLYCPKLANPCYPPRMDFPYPRWCLWMHWHTLQKISHLKGSNTLHHYKLQLQHCLPKLEFWMCQWLFITPCLIILSLVFQCCYKLSMLSSAAYIQPMLSLDKHNVF